MPTDTTSTDPTTTATERPAPWITALTDIVTVHAWRDEAVETNPSAIPTASDEALIWWTGSVGPTGILLAHRWSSYAATQTSTWAVDDIARTFGIGESVSRVRQVIDRLEMFGIICRHDRDVWVRLWLPPLGFRQQSRLPAYLAQVYPG